MNVVNDVKEMWRNDKLNTAFALAHVPLILAMGALMVVPMAAIGLPIWAVNKLLPTKRRER
jgi:hypothetical protein